ncbi:MAG: dihydroorotate dehydrogenase electron transfer subunit [Spirochaetes bacterium]|nr:dihydroorotate dehydrogenase electron transfer subunit [Spirochaetota bacterium]
MNNKTGTNKKINPVLLEKPVKVSKDHYLLKIDIENDNSHPGQFANIRITNNSDPLIRRPFSIFDHNKNIIEIVIKNAGRGTDFIINQFQPGNIDIIAPLGSGFNLCENKNVLLAGGGVGNAPLYYLAKELKKKNNSITYLFASRSAEYIYFQDQYSVLADKFLISTDDGTSGFKGLAGNVVEQLFATEKYDKVYICGPFPMMRSISEFIKTHETSYEVSLENYFGCGIGLCSGCTVETTEGTIRACIKGPVFDGRIINWDSLK